ncbi:putative aspartate-semialdehyde dehydrogenase [Zancudomyces culisetae]|uniref:Putative aspartate-semialdehyde dehydrogenase n=1 Tax=Zancudomyces culisetae TaxID=1213189 RepID=A0A1R1PKS5_ZANCU|nr:putative aspartate-semialdehyde dehydrogenase [Zancudomyces culisetae]|eukprot:OMH81565.1 putative aspartate-semialdehyde dehydrogenase [Zancudomyces culisetae]
MVPTANSEHMDVIPKQMAYFGSDKGFIVTNSNCSVSGVSVALKALQSEFGEIEKVFVTTLQAISGAGYPGVASLDIFDNVVPYISGEEEKIEIELLKILGSVDSSMSVFENLKNTAVSATCNRVPVLDGHLACVSVKFAQSPPPSVEQINDCLRRYRCEAQELGCYSAPKSAIHVSESPDRPQPRLDRMNDKGMGVTVGRVRPCNIFDCRLTVLVHNTILGAAGASILNAEIALKKGLIKL